MTKQKILRACKQQWWRGGSWKSQFYQNWTSLIRRKAMNSTKSLYRVLLWEFLFNSHCSTAMGATALDITTHFHQASESAPTHYCTSSLIAERQMANSFTCVIVSPILLHSNSFFWRGLPILKVAYGFFFPRETCEFYPMDMGNIASAVLEMRFEEKWRRERLSVRAEEQGFGSQDSAEADQKPIYRKMRCSIQLAKWMY